MALLVVATGAAAAVSTYHLTIFGPGKCSAHAVGTGTLSYDDGSHVLSGKVTHSVAPVTTTILYGPPDPSATGCPTSPCFINANLAPAGDDAGAREQKLADGEFVLFIQGPAGAVYYGQVVADDGGIRDSGCDGTFEEPVDAAADAGVDAGVTADAAAHQDAASAPDGASSSEQVPAPTSTASAAEPGSNASSCASTTGPTTDALAFGASMALVLAWAAYRRRRRQSRA